MKNSARVNTRRDVVNGRRDESNGFVKRHMSIDEAIQVQNKQEENNCKYMVSNLGSTRECEHRQGQNCSGCVFDIRNRVARFINT